jgi:hypothetical protein
VRPRYFFRNERETGERQPAIGCLLVDGPSVARRRLATLPESTLLIRGVTAKGPARTWRRTPVEAAQVMVQLAGEIERAISRLPAGADAEACALELLAAGLRAKYGGELRDRRPDRVGRPGRASRFPVRSHL